MFDFSKKGFFISLAIFSLILAGIWYCTIPAITFTSADFWFMLILGVGGDILLSLLIASVIEDEFEFCGIVALVLVGLLVIFGILGIASSKMFHANDYEGIARINQDGNFAVDIPAIDSSDDIPTIDKATAQKLGDRSMGTMEKYLSQFEVSSEYNLICYNGKYYRVSPLEYGGFFKYTNSKATGIPAYVLVDVYTGEVELVELDEGNRIRYSPSAYFSYDLKRHIRSDYASAVIGEFNFEIDDNGHPYYITCTLKANAGIFGARSIDKVLVVDATTGEIAEYSIAEVPEWVDNVYDVQRVMIEIDWKYTMVHGFWNFSDKDVRKTSYAFDVTQYYCIPKDGHVYAYTGVTSAGGDESNIGFLLINLRTGESTYYADPGAEESSAQESAKGLVQQYGYSAGPVMLVNIDNEQTYFFTLKDAQLLVKKYALVNKSDYTLVAVEDTVEQAVKTYRAKVASPNIEATDVETVEGVVAEVHQVVLEGTTMYVFYLNGQSDAFVSSIANGYEQVKLLCDGAKVQLTVAAGSSNGARVVTGIEFK